MDESRLVWKNSYYWHSDRDTHNQFLFLWVVMLGFELVCQCVRVCFSLNVLDFTMNTYFITLSSLLAQNVPKYSLFKNFHFCFFLDVPSVSVKVRGQSCHVAFKSTLLNLKSTSIRKAKRKGTFGNIMLHLCAPSKLSRIHLKKKKKTFKLDCFYFVETLQNATVWLFTF